MKHDFEQYVYASDTNTLFQIDENIFTYSSGQKQKLSLARALLVDAEIYLFDEITSALDTENKQIAFELIHYLKSIKQKTIILACHDAIPMGLVDEVIKLSDS
ncbi:ATP-binding cassette domain-containing protein [Paenibacillus farraposensis]|uniref:ATP-binding cassette domain-containing protein n=1 Tax=Paenibacillus farraposensis TaxID=2807095 RepID=UPI0036096F38